MQNIGGFGFKASVVASRTFPVGFTLTQFADDADPFDSPVIKIRETAMGLNGDLLAWGKAVPIPITFNIIPHSNDDRNLAIIQQVNKVGAGKYPVLDVITIAITYPDGTKAMLINGVMTDGPSAASVSSAGRMKTNSYSFSFENAI